MADHRTGKPALPASKEGETLTDEQSSGKTFLGGQFEDIVKDELCPM